MKKLNHAKDGDMDAFNDSPLAKRDRRPWEAPSVKSVGTIAEVLKGGGGKLSVSGGDPGEHRKESGGGG